MCCTLYIKNYRGWSCCCFPQERALLTSVRCIIQGAIHIRPIRDWARLELGCRFSWTWCCIFLHILGVTLGRAFAHEPMGLPVLKDWPRLILIFFFFELSSPASCLKLLPNFGRSVQAEMCCLRQAPFLKQNFVLNVARQQIPVGFFRNSGFSQSPWIQKANQVGEEHFALGTSKSFELLSQFYTASRTFADFIFPAVIISFEPCSSSAYAENEEMSPGKKAAGESLFSE